MRSVIVACMIGLACISLCSGADNTQQKRRSPLKEKSATGKDAVKALLKHLKTKQLTEAKKDASLDIKKSLMTRAESFGSKRNWQEWLCNHFPEYCATASGCAADEFECTDGSCIYDYWQCDGWNDCSDASDEQGCSCRSNQFTCGNGRCIPGNWQCDDWNDCGDGTDEANCPCADGEFTCVSDGSCIYGSWQCDDYVDCSDGSDEANCGNSCNWNDWSEWSACNTGCGAGQRSRTRTCSCSSGNCNGESVEYDICNGDDCFPEASAGCGTRQPVGSNNRIVGGEDAVRGAWPWQAQLFYYGSFICGGTLVGNRYVISAAHCFTGDGYDYSNGADWTVQLGKLYASSNIDSSNGEYESGVSQVIIHEGYNEVTSDNDIAVMVLSNPLPATNNFVNFACLDLNSTRAFDATSNCFTSGFGALSSGGSLATILQEANVPLIPRATCNGPNNYDGEVTNNMLCAGFVGGGIDSCQGDSGGPLVCAAKDTGADVERWYLVGVTSWGYGCAQANYPGVYTDVSQYIDWLQNKMA
ncbi:suppressor of tumorigenicity 14 protein homolog [Acanthaster planci]|uniref:Suppressor of tumorigenicity 14 protein homolog n=1 Tax=Acanthaster planci TaxID=133434 RepID=A0A8B7ZFV2_ACAPL|nr:suppressor of tumorigenicity 14 protein homolog [Acanthaster planci]